MKDVNIPGQTHEGSTYHIAHSITQKLGGQMVYNHRREPLRRVVTILLFLIAGCFILWKCRYGFANMDETFYLTIPYRLCNGDVLVQDEWHLSLFSSVFLVLPMRLHLLIWGTEGICLHFRYLYALVWMATAVFLFFRTRRYTYWGGLAAGLVFLLYAPYGIGALSYNSLGILFTALSFVILCTSDGKDGGLYLVGCGVLYGCSILCCPYLVLIWIVYLLAVLWGRAHAHVDNWHVRVGTFTRFTMGATLVGTMLLLYVFANAHTNVLDAIPHMLNDSEHEQVSLLRKIIVYCAAIYRSSPVVVPITIASVLLGVVGRIKPEAKNLSMISACIGCCVLQFSYNPYINYVMYPMSLVGFTVFLMSQSNLVKRFFYGLWVPGAIYGFCINLSSNQRFYAISSAMTVSAIAAMLILGVEYGGHFSDEVALGLPDDTARVTRNSFHHPVLAIVVLSVITQLSILAALRYSSVFWEKSMEEQTCVAEHGPEAGILMTKEKLDVYQSQMGDLAEITNGVSDGVMLAFTSDTWLYLASPYRMGTYSAWLSGLEDDTISRLEAYYELNPNKRPTIVYMADPDDEERVAHLMDCPYTRLVLPSGREALVKVVA